MMGHLSAPIALFLALSAATGYALATWGMKAASGGLSPTAILVMAGGFTAAAVAEVMLLRHAHLSTIYVTIVAVETLLVISYAYTIGEGFTAIQVGGAGLVLAGLALLSA